MGQGSKRDCLGAVLGLVVVGNVGWEVLGVGGVGFGKIGGVAVGLGCAADLYRRRLSWGWWLNARAYAYT